MVCWDCNGSFSATKPGVLKPYKGRTKNFLPRKGKDVLKFHPQILHNEYLYKYDHDKASLFEGAKTQVLMGLIKGWISDFPEEKFIVFTQFKPAAAIVGRLLNEAKIKFVYYTVGTLILTYAVRLIPF